MATRHHRVCGRSHKQATDRNHDSSSHNSLLNVGAATATACCSAPRLPARWTVTLPLWSRSCAANLPWLPVTEHGARSICRARSLLTPLADGPPAASFAAPQPRFSRRGRRPSPQTLESHGFNEFVFANGALAVEKTCTHHRKSGKFPLIITVINFNAEYRCGWPQENPVPQNPVQHTHISFCKSDCIHKNQNLLRRKGVT
jgi:hypothetical protein